MGITSTLFYNPNDSDQETLYVRISPTDEQFKEQKERWNDLVEYLKTTLNSYSGYPISSWLQGSYKFGTQIRPATKFEEYDIDLGIYYKWAGEAEDGNFSPVELKDFVQACLEEYKDQNPEEVIEVVDPAKERCCRIRFKGDFHIDIPSYHLDPDSDQRQLTTQADNWEDSDPKAFYLWFKDEFDDYERAKVRRNIQYLKMWAALKFKLEDRPSSVLLTVLAAEAFDSLTSDEKAADDAALLAVLEEIVDRIEDSTEVENPANRSEKLSDRLSADQWDQFLEKLTEFRDIARAALRCSTQLEAALKWSEAFEHFFPIPQERSASEGSSASRALASLSLRAVDIDIVAVSRDNPNLRWNGRNQIPAIPKNCSIDFTLANPENFPTDVLIEWIVHNGRGDAEYVNDMGHLSGIGLKSKTEHSEYKGTHAMDCIVRYAGRVIGYRRVNIAINANPVPRRNPLTRINYRAIGQK